MSEPVRWRCELTAELLDAAEPELATALAVWSDRACAAMDRRRVAARALRAAGIATAALGILVSWAAILLAPECARGRTAFVSYGAIPIFVMGGTMFVFWPGVSAELRRWVQGLAPRRAQRLLAPVRRRAPYGAEYVLAGPRLEARVDALRLRRVTDLASIREAVVGAHVACLFGRRWPGGLRRVVWLPDAAVRLAICASLRGAAVAVTELPDRPG